MVKKLLVIFFLTFLFSQATIAQSDDIRDKEILEAAETVIHDVMASPNPFSVSTRIRFFADEEIELEFFVKDLLGNSIHVQKLKSNKGVNTITFYRDDLAPGIYIYSIKTENKIISKRIVIK